MSRTDNTRPFSVIVEDKTLPRVKVEYGRPRFRQEDDHEFMPVYYGGINSVRGNAKHERKRIRRKLRAHQRQALHNIQQAFDTEGVDVPPIRGDRRCVISNLS